MDYRTKTVQHGNCTIVIHSPVLTKEERVQREQEITGTLKAMRDYIKENT